MTNRSRARAIGLAAALAAVVLTSACNDPKPPSPSTTTTTAPTPTSSMSSITSSPPLTAAEEDLMAAEGVVVRYWQVRDALAKDPHRSLNLVATVARGQAADQSRIILSTYVANGWTQTGEAVVGALHATTKDRKAFKVTACVDVSNVNFVDKAGKSVVKPGRPDRQRFTYAVAKASQGFFVTEDTLKGTAC